MPFTADEGLHTPLCHSHSEFFSEGVVAQEAEREGTDYSNGKHFSRSSAMNDADSMWLLCRNTEHGQCRGKILFG